MKIWLFLPLLWLALPAAAHDRIEIVRNGVRVTEPAGAGLERDLVRLLASCSVESTDYAVKPGTWAELRQSGWRVHLDLVTPMAIPTKAGTVWATEILVVLRPDMYPGHIYLRMGDKVQSFTKYSPEALLAVGRDPAVQLAGTRPYLELARQPR